MRQGSGPGATPGQAIELHGGEVSRARDRFKALAPGERLALEAFLTAL